ncbi:MAG: NAD-dependent epimerase/dehydratase family protein [Bacteriovoracaceae bacterium]
MRILITGGGGFLGTAIIKELLKNPENKITNFARGVYPELEAMGVKTIRGDIRHKVDVDKVMSYGFDVIFHVAAKAGVWGTYKEFLDINYLGTKNMVESAKTFGVPRFVYTSTPSVVFGEDDLLGVDEETPFPKKYLTAYAETKAMAEKLVLEANDSKDFMTCAIRPHLIWGPGDPHLFPRVIQRGRLGKLKVVGDGENLVDIVYVENAAMAHIMASKKLTPHSRVCGQAYFIGQERPVKLWDFINQVLAKSGIDPVMESISVKAAYRIGWAMEKMWSLAGIQKPEPPMTRFVALNLGKSHYFSHAKAQRDFGYSPSITIEEGLKRYFQKREEVRKLITTSAPSS